MVGQVKLEDSNVALINSNLAKEVRGAAAEFEPEWEGAGSATGIEIWRVEKLGIKRWPQEEYSKFFDGDSYIVLHTYKEGDSEKLLHNVHFWLGTHTSQDEAGVAAYKTVELDDKLGQLPIEYREVMGYESDEFVKLFPPAIIIMSGGIDSGFNHVKPEEYRSRLLHFKGKRGNIRVMEKPLARSSLNNGDVFVLDTGLKVYQWNGTEAGVFEKRQANEVVANIKSERKGKPETIILDGDEDCDEFWEVLGGRGEIRSSAEGGSDNLVSSGEKNMLKLSDASGELMLTEVSFSRDSLGTDDVYIVDDGGISLYVWVGNGASATERGKAFQHANDYLVNKSLPIHTPVCRVVESHTSAAFNGLFL